MNHFPKDDLAAAKRNLQTKTNDEMLNWWFEPELILDLSYWKNTKHRKVADLEKDVQRLFRFISKRIGEHFFYTLHIGREDSNPHAHVQAGLPDSDLNPLKLKEIFVDSWLHIIGPKCDLKRSEMALKRPEQIPALVRGADEYVEDYRAKNEMPPALSEDHRLEQKRQFLGARLSNYVHNGHVWTGNKRFYVACPKPRHGRCSHHQDVSKSGEI